LQLYCPASSGFFRSLRPVIPDEGKVPLQCPRKLTFFQFEGCLKQPRLLSTDVSEMTLSPWNTIVSFFQCWFSPTLKALTQLCLSNPICPLLNPHCSTRSIVPPSFSPHLLNPGTLPSRTKSYAFYFFSPPQSSPTSAEKPRIHLFPIIPAFCLHTTVRLSLCLARCKSACAPSQDRMQGTSRLWL